MTKKEEFEGPPPWRLTLRSRQLSPEPQALPGTKIAGRLNELATGEYFCGISNEELMQLFF